MIHLQAEPARVMPVVIDPALIRRIIAGRVRALILPLGKAQHLLTDDCLWVRESMAIPAKQPSPRYLRFSYGGDGAAVDLRWPVGIARPSAGFRPAEAMPVQASRLTLQVTAQRVTRLAAVSSDEAIAAGVEIVTGGFINGMVHEAAARVWEAPAGALAAMWLWQHPDYLGDPQDVSSAAANPEVVVVEFRAIHRNVADLVAGIGSGGVR